MLGEKILSISAKSQELILRFCKYLLYLFIYNKKLRLLEKTPYKRIHHDT